MTAHSLPYPRDLIGYGPQPPRAPWPGGARIAVQFVLNYEEGAESNILHGDAGSEWFLADIAGIGSYDGARHMSVESQFEYGARVGVWRVLDVFRERQLPLTMFAVAMALERNSKVADIALRDGHEICSHGLRWINYHGISEALEREHMARAIEIHTRLTGERPLGWYTGRSTENTRRLVCEDGGFLYHADDYSDDLPFWDTRYGKPQLIVPYSLDNNDMRFGTTPGFAASGDFLSYLKDAFDALYREGETHPRMMSVGLHCRLIGKPGRIGALMQFLDYITTFNDVWITRRIDIARTWEAAFPLARQEV
jgi:allantoinase